MASSLIPKDGGVNPINGLPIRRHVCVVYDNATLEILAIADTHNKADEIATDRFHRGIDAISSEIRYHNDDISPAMLVGMKMNDFQCFVDNNNHPLNPSTKKVDALTFVTDLDSVQLAYIESDIQKLTDMAVMERGNVLDIAVMKDDQLIGAFAFDTDNYMTHVDINIDYVYVNPIYHDTYIINQMSEKAVEHLAANCNLFPSKVNVSADEFMENSDVIREQFIKDIKAFHPITQVNNESNNESGITVVTDLDSVHAYYLESGEDTLADMATEERNCGTVLDIAILKDGEFAGGFAFELDNNDDHTELELTYVYVKAELRGKGLASRMSCAACDAITETLCNEPEHIKAFAHIESDGGWAVCDKVTQQLSERYPNATVSLHDENTMNIAP